MVNEWKGTQHRGKLGEKTLYATTGEECFKITSDRCIQVKGKSKALKMLISNKDHQDTFMELGREWDVSTELMSKLEHFTCLLYAPKTSSTNVNELRYHLFCAKKGDVESHLLPPCRDCLIQHTL